MLDNGKCQGVKNKEGAKELHGLPGKAAFWSIIMMVDT
jgi:hypothetical protein